MSEERYTVYVDMSAKIEDWERDSVIAVANGHTFTLLITAETKRAIATLINSEQPVQFHLLALFTYLVIRPHLHKISRVVIDQDYSSEQAERIIQKQLLAWIRHDVPTSKRAKLSMKNIKDSVADHLARNTYRGHQLVNGKISLKEVEEILQR